MVDVILREENMELHGGGGGRSSYKDKVHRKVLKNLYVGNRRLFDIPMQPYRIHK